MNNRLLAMTLGVVCSSCFGPITSYMKQDEGRGNSGIVNVKVREVEAGVVEGTVSASSNVSQKIEASASSSLAGSSVVFPPGALAIDTGIQVQEGASIIDDEVTTAVGITAPAIVAQTTPMVVTSTAKTDPVKPFTLAIPLGTALRFTQEQVYYAVIYKIFIYATQTYKVGIIPPAELVIENGKIVFSSAYFGSFSVVTMTQEVTEKKEVVTAKPLATKSEQQKDVTPPGAFRIANQEGRISLPYEVRWEKSIDAVGYEVRVGTDSGCSSPVFIKSTAENYLKIESLREGQWGLCVTAFDAVANKTEAANNGLKIEYKASAAPSSTSSGSEAPALPKPVISPSPASPSMSKNFSITGQAPVGTTVKLYKSINCGGTVASSLPSETYNTTGFPQSHAANENTSVWTVKLFDSRGTGSECSDAVVFSNPALIKDMYVGPNGSHTPNNQVVGLDNGTILFNADIFTGDTDVELIAMDDTNNPQSLDVMPSGNPNVGSLYSMGSYAIFVADAGSGYQLLSTTGSGFSQVLVGGEFITSAYYPINFAGKVWFQGYTSSTGTELFSFDGTTANAYNINPSFSSSMARPFTAFNNQLFFAADDGTSGMELWRINSSDPPQLVYDLVAGSASSSPNFVTPFQNQLYLHASAPQSFHSSDGSTIFAANAGGGLSPGPAPNNPIIFENKLFFMSNGSPNPKLYVVSSPTSAHTFLADLEHSSNLVAGERWVYFIAKDDMTWGSKLKRTNGTTIEDVTTPNTFQGSHVKWLTQVGDFIYFAGTESTATDFKLWRLNENTQALEKVLDMPVHQPMGNPAVHYVHKKIIFWADDGAVGFEPWSAQIEP